LAELAQGRRTEEREVLNERAMEVLQLLAQGARNKEIAAKLFLSERTVEYHLSTIFTRLGVSNRTEAVRAAIERGLLS
jgi:DNA-binding NarL/FixJ family response regulator